MLLDAGSCGFGRAAPRCLGCPTGRRHPHSTVGRCRKPRGEMSVQEGEAELAGPAYPGWVGCPAFFRTSEPRPSEIRPGKRPDSLRTSGSRLCSELGTGVFGSRARQRSTGHAELLHLFQHIVQQPNLFFF